MATHEETVEIQADADVIFDLMHDYKQRLSWDTFLREARLLADVDVADRGVASRCSAKWQLGGWTMDTIYIVFHRPRVAAVKMIRGPWFFKQFAASIRHKTSPHGTNVTYRFSVTCWPRFITPIVMAVLSRETHERLLALKQRIESA